MLRKAGGIPAWYVGVKSYVMYHMTGLIFVMRQQFVEGKYEEKDYVMSQFGFGNSLNLLQSALYAILFLYLKCLDSVK